MPGRINTRAEHPTYGPKTKGDVRADKGGPNKTHLGGPDAQRNQHNKKLPLKGDAMAHAGAASVLHGLECRRSQKGDDRHEAHAPMADEERRGSATNPSQASRQAV